MSLKNYAPRARRQQGFTLIELMVTMVVVAILTAIAVPSYGAYVQRAARADAKAIMGQAQQFMQRFYAMNNAYDQMLDGTAVVLPVALSQAPQSGNARYAISLQNLTAFGYSLQAVPQGPQSGDHCGTLTITNTNVRGTSSYTAADKVAECWR